MSDMHIYIEREQPVKVITLEPSGKRGPAGATGATGATGPAGPNSVTSATTSDGTADLSVSSVVSGSLESTSDTVIGGSLYFQGDSLTQLQATATETRAILFPDADGTLALGSGTNGAIISADITDAVSDVANGFEKVLKSDSSGELTLAGLVVGGNEVVGRVAFQDATGFATVVTPQTGVNANITLPATSGTVAITDENGNFTVTGTLTASHIHGNLAGSVYSHVRAGEALAKGDPVYVSGSHGTAPNLIPIVSKADASNAAKMPAVGIMDADLANNASGHMVITGTIADLNTNAYAVNSVLYVATGGGLTATPPAANSQPVAIVERVNTNNGALIVKVNGLASSGGNGASDANKLVRFNGSGLVPVASISGLGTLATVNGGTGVATFLANPTSANLAAAVSDETGSGSLVFGTSPTLTTPTIARSGNGTVATFQDGSGKTVTVETAAFGTQISINATGGTLGAYATLNGQLESWVNVIAASNTTDLRWMRFGTLSNRFRIDRLNDTATIIRATPFSFANDAPTNSFFMESGGGIGFGTATPSTRAVVDLTSTTRGFLPPRMTTAQRDAITSVPAGLQVYDATTNKTSINNGSAWANVLTDAASSITSATLAAAITDETGSGSLVFANSPTFTGTPLIGTKQILSENGFWRAFLGSDYTVATTSTTNKIPSFSINVVSGKTYKLEIMLKVTGVAGSTHNANLIGSFNLTAAESSMLYRRAGFETENFVSATTPYQGFSLFNTTGTGSQICFLDGIIKPSSSGTLEVYLNSGSATNSVTMLKGAYIEATLLD